MKDTKILQTDKVINIENYLPKEIKLPNHNAIILAPTGSGKSNFFIGKDESFVVLNPTKELKFQNKRKMKKSEVWDIFETLEKRDKSLCYQHFIDEVIVDKFIEKYPNHTLICDEFHTLLRFNGSHKGYKNTISIKKLLKHYSDRNKLILMSATPSSEVLEYFGLSNLPTLIYQYKEGGNLEIKAYKSRNHFIKSICTKAVTEPTLTLCQSLVDLTKLKECMLSEGIKENDLYVIYNEVNHRKGEPKSSNFQEYKERIHNGEIVHCICTATIGEGVEIHNTIPANCYILSNRFKSVHNYTQFACRLRGVINELGVFTSNLTKKDYSDNVEFNSKFDYSVYKSLPSTIGKKHNDIHWFKLLQQALSARNTLHTTYIKENGVLDKRCGKYNAFFNALRDIPFKLKVGIAFNIFGINCITSNRGVEFIDVDRVQELRTKECNLDINQLRRLFYTLVINLMQKAPAGEEKNTEYQLFSTYLGYEFKEGVITPPSKEYIPYKVSYEKHLPYKEMVQVALDFHREIDWLIIDMDSKVSRHLDNVTYVDKDGKEYVGTYESIAKELGITANNLRVRMTRRKVKLSNVESGKGLYVECFKEGLRCKESYDNVKEAIEDFKAKNPKCKEHHIKNFVQGLNASVDGYTVVDKVEKEKEQKKWDSVEYVMGFIKSVKFVNPEDIDENSLKLGWNWFKVNEDGTKTVITVPYNMSQSEALGKGYQPAWNLLGSGYGVIDTDCYNVITTDIMAELDRQGVHYTVNPKKPYSRHYWFIDQDNGTTIHGNGFDILRGGKNQQVFEIGRKLI